MSSACKAPEARKAAHGDPALGVLVGRRPMGCTIEYHPASQVDARCRLRVFVATPGASLIALPARLVFVPPGSGPAASRRGIRSEESAREQRDRIRRMTSHADRLRALLNRPGILLMPGCHDAMSARLIEEAGFELGFMSGFAVSAARLGMPDTGLISYGELVDQGQNICRAGSIPFIGDGDTGFGSAQNIKRTVQGYAGAGFAAIMLEDQVAPKRCGHTEGKAVIGRDEALTRIRAAVDARNAGADILIMARTDARACVSLDEAIARCQHFRAIGADITFLEAPLDADEMRRYCGQVDGPKMANLNEGGRTPLLPPDQLEAIGYKIAVYPLTLLNVSIAAMRTALASLRRGERPPAAMDFEQLKTAVGFPAYYEEEARYKV